MSKPTKQTTDPVIPAVTKEDIQKTAQEKADQLGKQHNCKVHPLIFKIGKDGDTIIGYMKDPPREMKLRIMDAQHAPFTTSSTILEAYLIKEESDRRIYEEGSDNEPYYFGAVMEVYGVVQIAMNQFKKK